MTTKPDTSFKTFLKWIASKLHTVELTGIITFITSVIIVSIGQLIKNDWIDLFTIPIMLIWIYTIWREIQLENYVEPKEKQQTTD